MQLNPASAHELAAITHEIGADGIEGAVKYPTETGSWPADEVLARLRQETQD
jgi:hypothetical protein